MMGSVVLLVLLFLSTALIVQRGREVWFLALLAVPFMWHLLGLHGSPSTPDIFRMEPTAYYIAAVVLLLLHGTYANGWLAPTSRDLRVDALALFAMYVLNIVLFLWLHVVPNSIVGEFEPFFQMLVLGFLPIVQFLLLRTLYDRVSKA